MFNNSVNCCLYWASQIFLVNFRKWLILLHASCVTLLGWKHSCRQYKKALHAFWTITICYYSSSNLKRIMGTATIFTTLTCCLLAAMCSCNALFCNTCVPEQCPVATNCPVGKVMDSCGCCEVCAIPLEGTCNTDLDFGRCADGRFCLPDGGLFSGTTAGKCLGEIKLQLYMSAWLSEQILHEVLWFCFSLWLPFLFCRHYWVLFLWLWCHWWYVWLRLFQFLPDQDLHVQRLAVLWSKHIWELNWRCDLALDLAACKHYFKRCAWVYLSIIINCAITSFVIHAEVPVCVSFGCEIVADHCQCKYNESCPMTSFSYSTHDECEDAMKCKFISD